jgi:hypothetical protein
MVKVKFLCVINHLAMKTYGGVNIDPIIISLELASFTSGSFTPGKEP